MQKARNFSEAGSILPYGPSIQEAAQSADPMELRIYRGDDGSFTPYEDENDGYNCESGSYATIPMTWNEATRTLALGASRNFSQHVNEPDVSRGVG